MAKTQDERLAEKTAERQFLFSVITEVDDEGRDFELAPALGQPPSAPATGQGTVNGQMA